MTEHRSNIAEIAIERAAARELNVECAVMIEHRQLPLWNRRQRQIRKVVRRIHMPGTTVHQIVQKRRESQLGLVQDKVIDLRVEQLRLDREERPAGYALHLRRSTMLTHLGGRLLLDRHRTDKRII